MTTTIRGTEHRNPSEAIQHLSVSAHDCVVTVGGRLFTVTRKERDRLDGIGRGVIQAEWFDYQGMVLSVPRS
jgi:hypothetical protein